MKESYKYFFLVYKLVNCSYFICILYHLKHFLIAAQFARYYSLTGRTPGGKGLSRAVRYLIKLQYILLLSLCYSPTDKVCKRQIKMLDACYSVFGCAFT